MDDSRISAFINSMILGAAGPNTIKVKVLSLPEGMAKNTAIQGQVTSVENGQVTITTDQGDVVLQMDIKLQVGQMLNLKLANVVQQAKLQTLAELQILSRSQTDRAPSAPPQRPVLAAEVETSPLAQQFEQIDLPEELQQKPVQVLEAKTVVLPQVLTEENLEQLIKTVLQIPEQTPLPPTLEEGVAKLKQLLPLLSQQASLPVTSPPAVATTSALPIQSVAFQNAILQQPMQSLLVLQQIAPGQEVAPETIRQIAQQIGALAKTPLPEQQNIQTSQSKSAAPNTNLPVPQVPLTEKTLAIAQSSPVMRAQTLIANFADKIRTSLPPQIQDIVPSLSTTSNKPIVVVEAAATTTAAAITPMLTGTTEKTIIAGQSYQPQLGLVMGQMKPASATNYAPLTNVPLLLFLTQENGNQILSLVAPRTTPSGQAPLLPGSIILAAQTSQTTPALLPQLSVQEMESLEPLHVALTKDWPAMEKLLENVLVQQAQQPTLAALAHQTIPAPNPQQFPAAALFFFAILKNGLSSQWLGDEVLKSLEFSSKQNLVAQLGRDLQSIQRSLSDDLPADVWRPLPMPLNVNNEIYRLQWFYRPHYDPADAHSSPEEKRQKKKTRFLVDVPKTNFGDLQIDGLVQEKTLDIILRTENELQKPMQNAIHQRYSKALDVAGFAGGLIFQAGREHYIHV